MHVKFSPRGGCLAEIASQLDLARKSIYLLAYEFTADQVAQALVRAHSRGIAVHACLDHAASCSRASQAHALAAAGIAVWLDSQHHIAHNKVIIVDESLLMTGSFNYTENAEFNNAENLLVIPSCEVAQGYLANWQVHCSHSKPYSSAFARPV